MNSVAAAGAPVRFFSRFGEKKKRGDENEY